MRRPARVLALVLAGAAALPVHAAESAGLVDAVTAFWQAATAEQMRASRQRLAAQSTDAGVLYQALRRGPVWSADVPRGRQESARLAADGTRFPYVYLIPEDYDPTHAYPVEFLLHGGVSRPAWEPGGGWWRGGFDSLQYPDRIIVVPASWQDAFWWHENQADNLPAILRILKRSYHVDENRVTLSGISDGGTGAWFFAFKQPTEWAAFLPWIAHPGVLRNPASGGGYRLYFENLMARPLYIVNGENDRLYPASSLQPFIDILRETGVPHVFRVIENGGHNTRWLPEEAPLIEQFKRENPRDPLPEQLRWVADRTDRFNRHLWIRIDELSISPGLLEVTREANHFDVTARGVSAFTLLLNAEEVDFSQPVRVDVNGANHYQALVSEDTATLLKWARLDLDRTMLFSAELTLRVGQPASAPDY